MFKRNDDNAQSATLQIVFSWDGQEMTGCEGDTVASALLGAGIRSNRSHPVTGEQRAPYCMMGVCFECLVEVDGVPNRQACQIKLRPGMRVTPQRGARA